MKNFQAEPEEKFSVILFVYLVKTDKDWGVFKDETQKQWTDTKGGKSVGNLVSAVKVLVSKNTLESFEVPSEECQAKTDKQPDSKGWQWHLCQERERGKERRCDLGIFRENSLFGDSLYRAAGHTVMPLNGKWLFAVACDEGSPLFTTTGHTDLLMFPFIL